MDPEADSENQDEDPVQMQQALESQGQEQMTRHGRPTNQYSPSTTHEKTASGFGQGWHLSRAVS